MKLSKYLLSLLICCIGFSQKYDPKTGELIQEKKYDPITGELIKITKYDPITGKLIIEDTEVASLIKLGDNVTLTTITGVVFKGTILLQDDVEVVLSSPSIGEIKVSRVNIKSLSLRNNNDLNKVKIENKVKTLNNNISSGPSYLSIINAAKDEAKRKNKNQAPINIGVGALGCAGTLIGMPIAALYALADTSGEPKSNYYNELNNENKNVYKSAYKAQMNKLKRTNVFGTMGAGIVLFFLMIISGGLGLS